MMRRIAICYGMVLFLIGCGDAPAPKATSPSATSPLSSSPNTRPPSASIPPQTPPPRAPAVAALFAEAEATSAQIDPLCEQLLEIVKDCHQPLKIRAAAARQLGALNYLPAIGDLVKLADLNWGDHGAITVDGDGGYPFGYALSLYGAGCLPRVLDQLVFIRSQGESLYGDHARGLWYAIHFAKTNDVAVSYLKGLRAVLVDPYDIERLNDVIYYVKPSSLNTQ